MKPIIAVDLFCGAGGTSTGILNAAKKLKRKIVLVAVNHWTTAVNTHSLNHPGVKHLCENVETLHPRNVVPGGRLDLLAASCECTFHSNARGGGPCNEQSRSQPWQLIRWATDLDIETILMENVREFQNWGPIYPCTCGTRNPSKHRKGSKCLRPIPERKGEFFRSFMEALKNLGRSVEYKVQVCADFGDPTSRSRLILISHKNNRPVLWPAPPHGPVRALPWRVARECIDWELKGRSVFKDGKPRLCANTMRRIAAGLKKFGGINAEPFLVMLNGTTEAHVQASARSIDEPMPTVVANGNHVALCEPFVIGQQSGAVARSTDEPLPTVATAGAIRLVEPFIIPKQSKDLPTSIEKPLASLTTRSGPMLIQPFITQYHGNHKGENSGERRNYSMDVPLPTVDTSNRYAIVEPIIVQTDQTGGNGIYATSVDSPLRTVVSKQNMLLVEPFIVKYYGAERSAESIDEPLDTVTTRDRFCLVETESGRTIAELDIRTRMLQPHELAAAHSFPKGYQFTGTKEDKTKQIGNSVPVELAAAHAEAALS